MMTPEEFALWFVGSNDDNYAVNLRDIVRNAIGQWEMKREKKPESKLTACDYGTCGHLECHHGGDGR